MRLERLKPIFIGFILLIFLSMPVLAEGTGTITHLDVNGSVVNDTSAANAIHPSSSSDKTIKIDNTKESTDSSSTNSNDIDVWGIQKNDMASINYADVSLLTRIYSGITPLRNVTLIGLAISFGLALFSVIGGSFLLVALAGIGGFHPNVTKGLKIISGARGRLIGIFSVFFLALFMIVMTFFFLLIFNKMSLFVA